MKKLTNREYFCSYITGIFEAAGTIYIPKNKYPKIYISFHKDNKALAEAIKERIGFGNIYEKKTNLHYEIFNREGILRFIEITKNYFRTPKIDELNNMIEYLNTYKNTKIPVAVLDKSTFESNAWLSGYLETSGTFTIYTNYETNYWFRFVTNYRIIHKKIDIKNKSYFDFLESLAMFFSNLLTESYSNPVYIITLDTLRSISILLNYLEKYPLFGVKSYNLEQFKSIHIFRENPTWKFQIDSGRGFVEYIEEIKNDFNINRPNYRAEHLDYLPQINDEEICSFF